MTSTQLARTTPHINPQPIGPNPVNVGELVHEKLIDKIRRQKLLSSRFTVGRKSVTIYPNLFKGNDLLDPDNYEFKVRRDFSLPGEVRFSFREEYLFTDELALKLKRHFYPLGKGGRHGDVAEMLVFLTEHEGVARLLITAFSEIFMFGDTGGYEHSFVGSLTIHEGRFCLRRRHVESLPTNKGSRFILFERSLDQSC